MSGSGLEQIAVTQPGSVPPEIDFNINFVSITDPSVTSYRFDMYTSDQFGNLNVNVFDIAINPGNKTSFVQSWRILQNATASTGTVMSITPSVTTINYPIVEGTQYKFTFTGYAGTSVFGIIYGIFTLRSTASLINVTDITPNSFEFDFNVGPFINRIYPTGSPVYQYVNPATQYFKFLQLYLFQGTDTGADLTTAIMSVLVEIDSSIYSNGVSRTTPYKIVKSTNISSGTVSGGTLNYPLVGGRNYTVIIMVPRTSVVWKTYSLRYPNKLGFNFPVIDPFYQRITYELFSGTTVLQSLLVQYPTNVSYQWIIENTTASVGTVPVNSLQGVTPSISYPLISGTYYSFTITAYYNNSSPVSYTSQYFTVTGGDPPIFSGPTGSTITVFAGTPGVGTLSTSGYSYAPLSSIVWTQTAGNYAGVIQNPAYNITNNLTTSFSSTITRNNGGTFYENDAGTYVCTATDPNGTATSTFTVNVTPAPPTFTGSLTDVIGKVSRTSITFTSPSFWGTVPIALSWSFRASGETTTVSLNSTSNVFTLPSADRTNIGRYFLTATNSVGSSTIYADITDIYDIPNENTIESQTVLLGSNVTFANDQDGIYPTPTYQWYYMVQPISGATGSSLTIPNVNINNTGVYSCIATNIAGSVETNPISLSVFKTSRSGLGEIATYNSGQGYTTPPAIICYGNGNFGAISNPTVDVQYIRRVRIAGGINQFTGTPIITVTGGGNTGCSLVPIMQKNSSDYYINSVTVPDEIANTVVYEPISIEIIGGNGVDAIVQPRKYIVTEAPGNTALGPSGKQKPCTSYTYPVGFTGYPGITGTLVGWTGPAGCTGPSNVYPGSGVVAVYGWGVGPNVANVFVAYDYDGIRYTQDNQIMNVWQVGDNAYVTGPILNSYKAKICLITRVILGQPVITPQADLVVISSDGYGSGCKGTVEFHDISSIFVNFARQFPFGNSTGGAGGYYNYAWEPEIKITQYGEGYKTQPLFQLVNVRTEAPADQQNIIWQNAAAYAQVKAAWYYSDLNFSGNNGPVIRSPYVCMVHQDFENGTPSVTLVANLGDSKQPNPPAPIIPAGYTGATGYNQSAPFGFMETSVAGSILGLGALLLLAKYAYKFGSQLSSAVSPAQVASRAIFQGIDGAGRDAALGIEGADGGWEEGFNTFTQTNPMLDITPPTQGGGTPGTAGSGTAGTPGSAGTDPTTGRPFVAGQPETPPEGLAFPGAKGNPPVQGTKFTLRSITDGAATDINFGDVVLNADTVGQAGAQYKSSITNMVRAYNDAQTAQDAYNNRAEYPEGTRTQARVEQWDRETLRLRDRSTAAQDNLTNRIKSFQNAYKNLQTATEKQLTQQISRSASTDVTTQTELLDTIRGDGQSALSSMNESGIRSWLGIGTKRGILTNSSTTLKFDTNSSSYKSAFSDLSPTERVNFAKLTKVSNGLQANSLQYEQVTQGDIAGDATRFRPFAQGTQGDAYARDFLGRLSTAEQTAVAGRSTAATRESLSATGRAAENYRRAQVDVGLAEQREIAAREAVAADPGVEAVRLNYIRSVQELNTFQRALLDTKYVAEFFELLSKLGEIVGIAGIIMTIFMTPLDIINSSEGNPSAHYVPDIFIDQWIENYTLPFAPGSVVISTATVVPATRVVQTGRSYEPGTSAILHTGGVAIGSSMFQGNPVTQPYRPYKLNVEIKQTKTTYSLLAVGIANQGNGFTEIPDIGITGGQETLDYSERITLAADMSCSALGPITHTSTDYFTTPPIVAISGNGVDFANLATASAVLSNTVGTGVLRSIQIANPLTNNFSKIGGGFIINTSNLGDYFQVKFRHPVTGLSIPSNNRPFAYISNDPNDSNYARNFNYTADPQVSYSIIQVTISDYGSGLTFTPNVIVELSALGQTVLQQNTEVIAYCVMDHPIDNIYITDNGSGYSSVPKIDLFVPSGATGYIVGTTVGSTGYASNFTPSISSLGFGYVPSDSLFAIPNFFINSISVTNNTTNYTTAPTVGITGTNILYDASIITPGVQTQGVSISVTNGGYYEIEPLSEFCNSNDLAGLNVLVASAWNDPCTNGLTYAIPTMNGRVVDCSNGIGIAAYSSGMQLPFTGVTGTATVTSVDGNGSGAEISIAKFTYSFQLNAYIIDKITIQNGGTGYTSSPQVNVKFTGRRLQDKPAHVTFYARIGGPLVSVNVVNAPTGFNFLPSVACVPYGQKSNYVAPIISPSLVDISSTGGSISSISIGNQGNGFNALPTINISPPNSGPTPTVKVNMGMYYIDVEIIRPGSGYTVPPTVVFTNAHGSGAKAKAVLSNGSVASVAFLTYGGGYIGECTVYFVRNAVDLNNSAIVDATGSATVINSTPYGPPMAAPYGIDGCGLGAKFNLTVNDGIYLTGSTGYYQTGVMEVPNCVKGIAKGSFYQQTSITDLVFQAPSQCWEIGAYAFSGCTGLKSVYIPQTVERICDGAFKNCTNLTTISFEGLTGPAFGKDVFSGTNGNLKMYILAGATGVLMHGGNTGWKQFSTSINVPFEYTNSTINDAKPNAMLGMTPLKKSLSTLPSQRFAIAIDSTGDAYWNNNNVSSSIIKKVDTNGVISTVTSQAYPITSMTIASDNRIYYTNSTNNSIFSTGLTGGTPVNVTDITSPTNITSDSNSNLYISSESTLAIYKYTIGSGLTGYVTLKDNTSIGSMACDSRGNLAISYPTKNIIYIYLYPNAGGPYVIDINLDSPCGLAFDNAKNLYIGSTNQVSLSGISLLASSLLNLNSYGSGFYTSGEIAFNSVTGQLLFNDGSNLCQLPVSATDIPSNILQALTSHDYNTVINQLKQQGVVGSGASFLLSPVDVAAINSTLPAGSSSGQLPSTSISYICPNTDTSITLPSVPTSTDTQSVSYAVTLPPGTETTITLPPSTILTVTYNNASPPTLTISSNQPSSQYAIGSPSFTGYTRTPFTVDVGTTFAAAEGVNLTLYSIGLTIFNLTYAEGTIFIPGVIGTPPPVVPPKQQGVDYSQYLNSSVTNALYPTYKEKGPVDSSEWTRRKRLLNSVSFS